MATAVEVVVDTGGTGDYATLAAAEAGEQRNLVTADEQLTIKCQCTTGVADNSPFTFAGWTDDATRYIKVWTDPAEGYRHTGKWDDSKYRNVNILSYDYLDFGQVRIAEGLQLYQSAYNGLVGAALLSFDSCIVKGYLKPVGGGTISNCLFLYSGYNTKGIDNNWRGSQYTYNCTFVGIALGMSIVTGNIACTTKNCLFYDCAADYYQSVSTSKTQTNCATDNDSAASGLSSAESTHRFEQTFGFVNSGSGDYHLTSSDGGAKGYGTNLYATFTTDIDGQARPSSGAWCIGADEYIAAGGGDYVDLVALMAADANITTGVGILRALAAEVPDVVVNVCGLSRYRGLDAILSSDSGIGADISRVAGMSSDADDSSSGAGELSVDREFSATIQILDAIAANLSTAAAAYVDFASTIGSEADFGSVLAVTRAFSAEVSAAAAAVAVLSRYRGLEAAIAAGAGIDADMSRYASMSASISDDASISGVLGVIRSMQATVASISEILAALATSDVVYERISLQSELTRQINILSGLTRMIEVDSDLY